MKLVRCGCPIHQPNPLVSDIRMRRRGNAFAGIARMVYGLPQSVHFLPYRLEPTDLAPNIIAQRKQPRAKKQTNYRRHRVNSLRILSVCLLSLYSVKGASGKNDIPSLARHACISTTPGLAIWASRPPRCECPPDICSRLTPRTSHAAVVPLPSSPTHGSLKSRHPSQERN